MIKTARAIYSIELDDDYPQYKLIFVFATCPYCARVHTHGPTEYLHAQVTAEKIVNGLQGGRRSANCNGGEYLLDFDTR